MAIIPTGTLPPNGASNAGGIGENRDSRPMSGFLIDGRCCVINNFDHRPRIALSVDVRVLRRPRRISESCLSQPGWTTAQKRTERNLIVQNNKPEAEVLTHSLLRLTS